MERKNLVILIVAVIVIVLALFWALNTCSLSCVLRGYSSGACKTAPLIQANINPCSDDETSIGPTIDCNPGNLIGASYQCCCK